jgi:phosphatidylglycerol---prolipoprotein diacylglyceryl transferase
MPFVAIPFPVIDPVLVQIGPLAIRWYALAYIGGLLLGWWLMRRLVVDESLWRPGQKRPSLIDLDDLLIYVTLGVILGGRIGHIVVYGLPYYLANPGEILLIWQGGMSFHGGLAGVIVALALFSWRRKLPLLTLFDLCAVVVPIGLFLGRVANFINQELWGRPTDLPWAVVFPRAGPLPRHPSQLYEALTEGVVLFVVLWTMMRRVGFRQPGLISGLFGIGYGAARSFCELFREPDSTEILWGPVTMGMALSIPMAVAGALLLIHALRRPASARSDAGL